jgi:lysophospholipid acyltransferase (LPLAT)-like uncharacterized protein
MEVTCVQSAAAGTRGPIIPQQAKWHGRLAARIVHSLIALIAGTLRYEFRDRSGLFCAAPATPVIFAIWHSRLALSLVIYRKFVQAPSPSRRLAALVSASRDGGLLARILELFGVQPVRGSSSRRGSQALLELTRWAERGHDIAITPDGPRGPCQVVQEGVISLAQLTGLPVVPVSYTLGWKIQLRSWDRFQIPLPFSRCQVVFSEVLRVPREADEILRAQLCRELESRLCAGSQG